MPRALAWIPALAVFLFPLISAAQPGGDADAADDASSDAPDDDADGQDPDADDPDADADADGEDADANGEDADADADADGADGEDADAEDGDGEQDGDGAEDGEGTDESEPMLPIAPKIKTEFLTDLRGSPKLTSSPVNGDPVRLFSTSEGRVVAQMPNGQLIDLDTKKLLLNIVDNPRLGDASNAMCAPGPDDKFACLWPHVVDDGNGQTTSKLDLITTDDRTTVDSGGGDQFAVLGLTYLEDGTILFVYTVTYQQGQQYVTKQYVVEDGDRQESNIGGGSMTASLADVGSGNRHNPAIHFVEWDGELWLVRRDGDSIVAHKPGETPTVVAPSSLYDIRPVVGNDGWLYVFYHEPSSQTAHVAASKDGSSFKDMVLDGKESGWQVEAAAGPDKVHGVFYYFRNTYNKGLRHVALKDGKLVDRVGTIFREDQHNAGWHPHLAIGNDGRTWLSWLSNVEEETRVWSRFDHPAYLRETIISGGEGSEEAYKDWFLQTGAGGWLTFWHATDIVPSVDEIGVDVGNTEYNVGASVLLSANLEARYKSFNIGLSFAQSIVDDAAKEVDDSTGVLNGNIKLDELFPGHDFKVAGLWGRYRGLARPGDNTEGNAQPIETNYIDLQALALNKWRVKYGVAYTTYEIPQSVHIWTAPEGSTSYNYERSVLRYVRNHDIDLIIGYSKLDYAAKYENFYNGLILDATGGGGLAIQSFEAIDSTEGDATGSLNFHVRFEAMLGWLFMYRLRSLDGFGFYVRPAYNAQMTWSGLVSEPSRESDQADSGAVSAQTALFSFRHGPWLDAGLVW